MKRFNILLLFFCLSNILFAQNNLNQLFKRFRTSVELPYYYKSKVLYNRVADNILDLSIIDGKMIIKYTMSGNRFTVEIDIVKSKVRKGKGNYDNRVWIENNDGIIITNEIKDEFFKENLLMNWFILEANSQALRDKLYNEINKSFTPYYPKIKKTNKTRPKNEIITSKKSKSGRYAE